MAREERTQIRILSLLLRAVALGICPFEEVKSKKAKVKSKK
jgi:hypothetical protein